MNLKPAAFIIGTLAVITTTVVLYAKKKDDELDVKMEEVHGFDRSLLKNMKPANA